MNLSCSVIIPTYNRADFLKTAIDSVLSQLQSGDEVIVVDDGSTDTTSQVLAEYQNKVRSIRVPNGGAGKARNIGIRMAQNDLVAFIDSDDYWLPGKLQLQRTIMEKNPSVLYCFTDFYVKETSGKEHHNYLDHWKKKNNTWEEIFGEGKLFSTYSDISPGMQEFLVYQGNLYLWQLTGFYVLTSSVVVRRKEAGDALFFDEELPIYEDVDCFAGLSRKGKAAYLDIETVCQTDIAKDRLTKQPYLEYIDSMIKIVNKHWGDNDSFITQHYALFKETLKNLESSKIKTLLIQNEIIEAKKEIKKAKYISLPVKLFTHFPETLIKLIIHCRNGFNKLARQT